MRAEFWKAKLGAHVERDARNVEALRGRGWTNIVVWECEIGAEGLQALYDAIVAVEPRH